MLDSDLTAVDHLDETRALDRSELLIAGGSGDVIMDLDPARIWFSPYADRLTSAGLDSLDELMDSMSRSGQVHPIVVRAIGDAFVCVCGRRRLEAARRLGITIKAFVHEFTKEEAILLQGLGNAQQQALTYIERAVSARSLDRDNVPRSLMSKAMAVDETEVSRFLSVTRELGDFYIDQIGPAPKIGRPRWVALTALLSGTLAQRRHTTRRIHATFRTAKFQAAHSNDRFAMVFDAANGERKKVIEKVVITLPNGRMLARVSVANGVYTLKLGSKHEEFAKDLTDRLLDLYGSYALSSQAHL